MKQGAGKSSAILPFQPKSKSVPLLVSRQITDPDDLYIPKPLEGESAPVAGRVSLQVKDQIQVLVQGGRTRFEKESDFVRSAVTHYLTEVVAPLLADKKLSNTAARIALFNQRLRQAEQIAAAESFMKRSQDTLTKLAKLGFDDALNDLWWEIRKGSKLYGGEFSKAVRSWMDTAVALEKVRRKIR